MGKKDEEQTTTTTTEAAAGDSAVTDAGQVDEMSSLLADGDGSDADAGADLMDDGQGKSGDASAKEPDGKPDAKADADASSTKDTDGTKDKPPGADGKKPDEPAEKKPDANDPLEAVFSVPSADGVRQVKAKDLITTYQQFGALQRRHVALKPIIDLSEKAQVPIDQIYPLLLVGIEATRRAQGGNGGAGGGPATRTAQAGSGAGQQYQGPFKDAEEDAYIKESDPAQHTAMWNVHRQNQTLMQQIQTLQQSLTTGQQSQQNTQAAELRAEYGRRLEDKITSFAGTHTDYFKPGADGKSERMQHFKAFLGRNFGHMEIDSLSPEVLSTAFAAFDPTYYNSYLTNKAKSDMQRLREQDKTAFSETGQRRPSAPGGKLTEQQEHMADMFTDF